MLYIVYSKYRRSVFTLHVKRKKQIIETNINDYKKLNFKNTLLSK